ncbi:hypothetical protein E1178_07100 [Roseibium hamelinense]|nr:hypothetical protein [Roseibium hamelinense]MTI43375.1 hypothetical protein [Roseibium hamelinense]
MDASVPEPGTDLQQAAQAYDLAWSKSGLVFTAATFISEPASGYGQFTPRRTTIFSPSETLLIYIEPVGYGFQKAGESKSYDLSVDFRLLNTTGQVLAKQDGFAQFSQTSRNEKRELSTSLTFEFDGLPDGSYTIETIYRDRVDGKSGTVSLPFTVQSAQ